MEGEAELYKAGIDVAKDLVKEMLARGYDIGRAEAKKLSIDFDFAFRRFLDRNEKRLSKVKLIINPAKPVLIESFFEPPTFEIGNDYQSEEDMIAQIMALRFCDLWNRWLWKINIP